MTDSHRHTQRQIARSASIVSIGNMLSRAMGLVRSIVISGKFGAENAILAYTAAKIVPIRLYELVIGGMITSALVPTLSEFANKEKHDELWHVASLLFTLAALVLGIVTVLLQISAPLVARIVAIGFDASLQAETTRLLRIVSIGILFLGFSGLTTAICQALQRFTLPAFTTAIFNTIIVLAALVLGPRWNVRGLAVGLVVGAACQFALQLPALRDMQFRPTFDFKHPALRSILVLFLPIILGMFPNELGILLDRNLASRLDNSMAIMEYATQLIQFPLGLVSMAIATAILPTLARQATREPTDHKKRDEFSATLASGLRLVLVLTIPAAAGLLVLAEPIVELVFQHGEFTPQNTVQTALALRFYLIGMFFAAIDQLFVFAFYARKDTVTPALVGVLGVLFYAIVALPTWRSLGMIGLLLGNGAQLGGHAVVMLVLFWRKIGPLSGYGIGMTFLKSLLAALVMGATVWSINRGIDTLVQAGSLNKVLVGGGSGVVVYFGMCILLRVRELDLVRKFVKRRDP
ncbi:MAG: murein biosynthesis integral membrane protein MurJ [Anaerolineae bacterium]|nr:murein biosynthesis integral membrane protein MurJ [Anaerolineae bacterium]